MAELPGKYANRAEKKWHVVVQGQKLGPLSDVEIVELIHGGKLKRDSMAWRKGLSSWQPCDSIPSLSTLFLAQDTSPPIRRRPFKRVKRKHVVLAGFVSFLVAGLYVWRFHFYVPPQDVLVATFLSDTEGKQVEALKVTKSPDGYFIAERNRNGWGLSAPARRMGETEFAELLGENWEEARPIGLVTHAGGLAVLKIAEGWASGEFTCSTGYFLMKPSGPIELEKAEERLLALPSLAMKLGDGLTTGTEEALTPTPVPSPSVTIETASANPMSATTDKADSSPAPQPTMESSTKSELNAAKKMDASTVAPAKPIANPVLPKQETDLESARRRTGEERAKAEKLVTASNAPFMNQFLRSGDQILELSRASEERGDLASALLLANRATQHFQSAETTAQSVAQVVDSMATHKSGPIAISASALNQTTFKPGDTVQSKLSFTSVMPSHRLVRTDMVMQLEGDKYVPFLEKETADIPTTTSQCTHTSNLEIPANMPSGEYQLRSEVTDTREPGKILFAQDFRFIVENGEGLKESKGMLGKVGGALEKAGVKVRVERK